MAMLRNIRLGAIGLTVCCLLSGAANATPINGNPTTGLAAPAGTIFFNEIVLPDNTVLNSQYASYGIASASGLYYNGCPTCATTPPTGAHPSLSNFSNGNVAGFTATQSIKFSDPAFGAAFQFASNGGTFTFTALVGGNVVESFNGNGGTWGYYGFSGIALDEIQIVSPSAFLLDNLQLTDISTPTATQSLTPSLTLSPTVTLTPSLTPSSTPASPTATSSITLTPSLTPSATPASPTATVTITLTPSLTASATPASPTPTSSITLTPSLTASATPASPTPTSSITLTPSLTPSATPASPTATSSITLTPSLTPSATPASPTATSTITLTPSLTASATPASPTATSTVTLTPSLTPSATPSGGPATPTNTYTPTPTPTATPTATVIATCPPVPSNTCFAAGKGNVLLKDTDKDSRKTFTWEWLQGVAPLTQADFGNPVSGGTAYSVCVYDQTAGVPALKMELRVSAGGICGAQPCWKPLSDKGWTYKNPDGNAYGVEKLEVKGGAAGKPTVEVIGKGTILPLPAPISGAAFFAQNPSVLVQLYSVAPANCWSSGFTPPATKNTAAQFKDKTP